jgi:hypothetical protein
MGLIAMNRLTLAAAMLTAAAAFVPGTLLAAAAGQSPEWPAGAQQKDDPRVLAFYDGMCAQYADRQGLGGDAREAFVTRCRGSIPNVFPVGYDESSGGGEE